MQYSAIIEQFLAGIRKHYDLNCRKAAKQHKNILEKLLGKYWTMRYGVC